MDTDLAFCVQLQDKTIPYSENYYKIPPLLSYTNLQIIVRWFKMVEVSYT